MMQKRSFAICTMLLVSLPPPLSALVAAAVLMDDITQEGFSRRYYRGAGISMEPFRPFSAHRFGLRNDPNFLKGSSESGYEPRGDTFPRLWLFIIRIHPSTVSLPSAVLTLTQSSSLSSSLPPMIKILQPSYNRWSQ